jgi:hypothetical protein
MQHEMLSQWHEMDLLFREYGRFRLLVRVDKRLDTSFRLDELRTQAQVHASRTNLGRIEQWRDNEPLLDFRRLHRGPELLTH